MNRSSQSFDRLAEIRERDLATVGAVLGHKSTASTKRYAHWQTGRLADALAAIGRKVPHPKAA